MTQSRSQLSHAIAIVAKLVACALFVAALSLLIRHVGSIATVPSVVAGTALCTLVARIDKTGIGPACCLLFTGAVGAASGAVIAFRLNGYPLNFNMVIFAIVGALFAFLLHGWLAPIIRARLKLPS